MQQLLLLQELAEEFAGWPYLDPARATDEYLDLIARKYAGDFCWSASFAPEFVWRLMQRGFLPMACLAGPNGDTQVLLPKLHLMRCLVALDQVPKPHKSTLRKSNKFTFSVDTNFTKVMMGIRKQHGEEHCWLYDNLVTCFHQLHSVHRVVHTFEVYFQGELVAGEVGYCVGGTYTSLSGYSSMDSAGTVQMFAMAGYLKHCGYVLWDLGMQLAYKQNEFGGREVPRKEFLRLLDKYRACEVQSPLPTGNLGNAKAWMGRLV